MYDVCKQIAVEAHLFALDLTGKGTMASIVKTTIGIGCICKCFVYTMPWQVNFSTYTLLANILYTILP